MKKKFTFLLLLFVFSIQADLVKPALVEISVYSNGIFKIEVRTSIEALLTGISSQYKNTKDSPNAKAYDDLRILDKEQLTEKFAKFHKRFTQIVKLKLDNEFTPLNIIEVDIPEPGYTKVPRISVITLTGKIQRHIKQIRWYYPSEFADNAVRVRQVDVDAEKWHWSNWQWLRDDNWSQPFDLTEVFHQQPLWSIIKDYTRAGFDHILPKGFDHILFILGIFLLSTKIRPLLLQVTMFTLAHSITLSLAMFNIINIPSIIVEPMIALSIVYIAFENILTNNMKSSRLIVVFIFGLLHGMGFASMLADFGMPKYSFTSALISFNIGVELGQLTIITLAYMLVAYWFRNKKWYRKIIIIPISIIIGLIGLYWTYDRIIF